MADKFIIAFFVIICGFIFYNLKNINVFFNKPVVSDSVNLVSGKDYPVKRIVVIDSNSYGVLTDGLYYVKLNFHATDDAKNCIAELINSADRLFVSIKRIEGTTVFVDFTIHKDNDKFKLSHWLAEKGLVYKN